MQGDHSALMPLLALIIFINWNRYCAAINICNLLIIITNEVNSIVDSVYGLYTNQLLGFGPAVICVR